MTKHKDGLMGTSDRKPVSQKYRKQLGLAIGIWSGSSLVAPSP